MTKEIKTSFQPTEEPYMSLLALGETQIKEIDKQRKIYQLGIESPVLVEGVLGDGSHEYLANIILQEELLVLLESVGRNVKNPSVQAKAVGIFRYDLGELAGEAEKLRERTYGKYPDWVYKATSVEMFLARQNFEFEAEGKDLSSIEHVHLIAYLSHDPRTPNRNPSKNFRLRHHI